MVNKLFETLNGVDNGKPIILNLNVKEYKMNKLKDIDYYNMVIRSWSKNDKKLHIDDDLNEREEIIENAKYIEPDDKMLKFRAKYFKESLFDSNCYVWKVPTYGEMGDWEICNAFRKHYSFQEILDYLGVIPFTPSVMINISPNWDSVKCCKSTIHRIKHLKYLIEKYMAEGQRYDKYSYVIENGHMGKHIHAHIVGHINPKNLKGVETHLSKGRQTIQIKKWNDKVEGMEGVIGGVSIQKTILRTEEIVNDKLDYLIEDRKPEGHKNKSIIGNGRVDVVLFTVKY